MNFTETSQVSSYGLPWMILWGVEGLLILAGNSVTIFIFIKIRNSLRRASYLLINLTVADLALTLAISLYILDGIAQMRGRPVSFEIGKIGKAAFVIDLLASTGSLLSLSLISLERMFAILWPFRHRMLETWHYFTSIIVLWSLAIANVAVTSYLFFRRELIYAIIGFSAIAFISILVTTTSYLAIWIATKRTHQNNVTTRSMAQNKKLAKTLGIVTIFSLIAWLPAGISFAFPNYLMYLNSLFSEIATALQYANSCVNPVVYCFRMNEFQKTLKKLCCRCYLRTRPSPRDSPVFATHGISLTAFKRTSNSDMSCV